jgi:hypothetical protein
VTDLAWPDYRREVFGDPYDVWHDGTDFGVLMERYRADGDTVLDMLERGMAANDELAARSLEHIARSASPRSAEVRRSATPPRVERMLRAAFPAARGRFMVRVAEALFALTDDPAYGEAITSVLVQAPWTHERMDAAIALVAFAPTRRIVDALATGVRAEEYLLRYHSARSLSHLAGGPRDVSKDPELLELIASPRQDRVRRSDRKRWALAADRLTAPFAGL